MSKYSSFIASYLTKRSILKESPISNLLHFITAGVTLSVMLMLLTVFIGNGFKKEVKKRVTLLSGDILLSSYYLSNNTTKDILVLPEFLKEIEETEQVKDVLMVKKTLGIIKTKELNEGVLLLGLSSDQVLKKIDHFIIEGEFPSFIGKDNVDNPIILSPQLANKLGLKLGDKIPLYLMEGKKSMRLFTLKAIADLPSLGTPIVITPLSGLQKILQKNVNEVGEIEIFLENPPKDKEAYSQLLINRISRSSYLNGQRLGMNFSEEIYPSIYSWLEMLNDNINFLLLLLLLVVGFTMISGVLIFILDRTKMVGILKVLGATDYSLQKIFLFLGFTILKRGLFLGNTVAFLIYGIQSTWKVLSLDPSIYYVSYIPMSIDLFSILAINIGIILFTMLLIILPTCVLNRIRPSETIQFS